MAEQAKKTILVVDDDPIVRRIVARGLSKNASYDVVDVDSAESAIEWLRAQDFRCDLVLTDMKMPGMSGEELIISIENVAPHIPFIVISAYQEERDIVRCLAVGAYDYLLKPIKTEDLCACVQQTLLRHQRGGGTLDGMSVQSSVAGWVELTAPSRFEYVDRFQRFTSLLGTIPISKEKRAELRLALSEMGQNAIEWGNRNDPTKQIHLSYCLFHDRIVFKIVDEGPGFNPHGVADPSSDPLQHVVNRMKSGKRPGGYGIFITRKLMDEVVYSDTGNIVLLTKYLSGPGVTECAQEQETAE